MPRPELLNGPRARWLVDTLVGIALSLPLVAGVTVLIGIVLLFFKIEYVTILYLIPVLVAALRWGVIPAVCAAIAGVAAPAFFFYPPIFDFRVHNPDQAIDLVLFIIVAIVTGQLAVTVLQAKMRAQAESLRDALIGSVSHELRTPLASIVGSASILARSPTIGHDEHLSSLVRVVRDEAERLNGDIQNLLDATRISSEGIRPHWEWVDPEDIVNGALARKRWLLANRAVSLAVADDLPLVYVDATLVESALDQLIENAVKYSPPGPPISIGAAQAGDTIQITVADEGEGLVLGEAERIFERFYRSPRNAGTIPGSGLGLWIARALIEACGGRVQAFSPGPGHGTSFRIDLPVKAQPPSDEHADD
ncbi:MAG: PAS domain-containing sensor histidine kinase [Rhizobiales bacterium]|nr:PAS domain-containing sensor histidine kinase [Hyphomicrobiales bacterium]